MADRIKGGWYSISGVPASKVVEALPYYSHNGGTKKPLVDLGIIAGSAQKYSNEKALIFKPQNTPAAAVQALPLMLFQIHGILPSYLTLNAVTEAAYSADVKSDGTIGVPADTDRISNDPFDTTDLDYIVADGGYGVLRLQANKAAGADTIDFQPNLLEGESGLIVITGQVPIADGRLSSMPAGDLNDFFQQSDVDMYVSENGILNRIGCYERNQFSVTNNDEYTDMEKNGKLVGKVRSKEGMTIKGQFSGMTPYNFQLLTGAELDESHPRYVQLHKGDNFLVDQKPVYLIARHTSGRVAIASSGQTTFMTDGDWALGAYEGAKYGFTCSFASGFDYSISREFWQFERFYVKVGTSA